MKASAIKVGSFYALRDGTLVRVAHQAKVPPGEKNHIASLFHVYEQAGEDYYVHARDIAHPSQDPEAR